MKKNDCHDETGAAHRHRDETRGQEARARRLATHRERRHASREGEDASVRPGTARSSSTTSSPVAVGPHVKSARPGVLMLTRRSPTAIPPASGVPTGPGHARCRDVSDDEDAERAGRRPHHDGVRVRRGSRLGNGVALLGSGVVEEGHVLCAAAVAGWTLLSFVVTGSRCSKLAAFAWSRRRRRAVRC